MARLFRIREYYTYYKQENPESLLFNLNNEGTKAPEDTQAIEGIQVPEDTESPETSEAKRARKGNELVECKDPTAIRLETSVENEFLSDSETATTDFEPEGLKANETDVDIEKANELKTSVEYVIISDSESATDSEPEAPKGNETGVETSKETIEPMDLDYDTSRTISDELYYPNEDSDDESDDISLNSLKKRKARVNKKKRLALGTKKPRFDNVKSDHELDGSDADLLYHFYKAVNLDEDDISVSKESSSHSRPGCSEPSGSGSVMDQSGGAKKQHKVPRIIFMTPQLSRIIEGLKSEFSKKKLPEASLAATKKGSGVCDVVDECEPSCSETAVARAGGVNGVGLALVQAEPLDHEVLNCTLNMNPSEFCTESARNFRRTV